MIDETLSVELALIELSYALAEVSFGENNADTAIRIRNHIERAMADLRKVAKTYDAVPRTRKKRLVAAA
jgi:hypothetical protein